MTSICASIRCMRPADSKAVAALLAVLGYTADAEQVLARLLALREWPDQEAFVADVAGVAVGLCQVQGVRLLASDGYAEVHALVVASAHQREGVGAALLSHARDWSHARGYARVRLHSGMHREAAHRFYEAAGFSRSKPNYAFEARRRDNSA